MSIYKIIFPIYRTSAALGSRLLSKRQMIEREQLRAWMDGAAVPVALDIADDDRERIVAQLELNLDLIAPLLTFDLPPDGAS